MDISIQRAETPQARHRPAGTTSTVHKQPTKQHTAPKIWHQNLNKAYTHTYITVHHARTSCKLRLKGGAWAQLHSADVTAKQLGSDPVKCNQTLIAEADLTVRLKASPQQACSSVSTHVRAEITRLSLDYELSQFTSYRKNNLQHIKAGTLLLSVQASAATAPLPKRHITITITGRDMLTDLKYAVLREVVTV